MPESYKVVRVQEEVELPSYWQLAATKEEQFARALEETLNRMASDGWTLASTYVGLGSAYLIFRRQA